VGRGIASVVLVVLVGCGTSSGAPPHPTGVACEELEQADPWAVSIGAHGLADRGALLRCVHAATMNASSLEAYVIAYVSEGRPGVATVMTALVYAPLGGAVDLPIVALGHAASGIGPRCGPSRYPVVTNDIALPLVAQGYVVVAPDFAGLGIDDGSSSFLIGASESAAMLDALTALRRLDDSRFRSSQLGHDLFFAGHSQGGHAALFAHAGFDAASGLRLLGSIALAPGLGSATEWAAHARTASDAVARIETYGAMYVYSRARYAGRDPSAWLSPAAMTTLPTLFHDHCGGDLLRVVPAAFRTVGDLYQPSFLSAMSACVAGEPCTNVEPWQWMLADRPGDFVSTAPVLVVQGLADTAVPPAATACVVDRLAARGTPVTACAYEGVDHAGIVARAMPDVIRWMSARRANTAPDPCATPLHATCIGP
jgi:dienelactone hydrolase